MAWKLPNCLPDGLQSLSLQYDRFTARPDDALKMAQLFRTRLCIETYNICSHGQDGVGHSFFPYRGPIRPAFQLTLVQSREQIKSALSCTIIFRTYLTISRASRRKHELNIRFRHLARQMLLHMGLGQNVTFEIINAARFRLSMRWLLSWHACPAISDDECDWTIATCAGR